MLDGKTLRWGICSAGKICHDFTGSLEALPKDEHLVKAVAASSLVRAKKFAEEFGIRNAYGSYQELANDPEVDAIYIGSINPKHNEQAKMMLEAGKAVLCEKPCGMTVAETRDVIELAKTKNVFFMEGMWSNFFPVYQSIRKAIDNGEIGEVKMVQASYGVPIPQDPSHRVANKTLGGGALINLGIYNLALAQFVFQEKPTEVQVLGSLSDQGVDNTLGVTLKYSKQKLASMMCSTVSLFPNEGNICGTRGMIKITPFVSAPTKITINGVEKDFPLPQVKTKMYYPNGEGFIYEAQEVRRCLMNKLIESPVVSHSSTIELAEITAKLLKDVGYGTLPP